MEETFYRLAPASLWLAILWLAESFVVVSPPGRWQHGLRNLALAGINGLFLFFTLGGVSIWIASVSPFAPSSVWVIPHAVVCFVVLDLFSYGWHRLNHAVPMLWRLHSVHHSDEHMDVTTAGRFHAGELAVGALLRLPLLYCMAVSTTTLLAYETVLVLVSMLHHSSISLGRWDRSFRMLISTPAMHSIHHSRNPSHFGSNFSSVFSVWDRVFATFQLTNAPISHGLENANGKTLRSLITMPLNQTTPPIPTSNTPAKSRE